MADVGIHLSSGKRKRDQRGMASIVITMVTMVVISLIVLGFAVLSRREQRQTLDQQLSAQAFYAAESGVEDAKAVIRKAVADGTTVQNRTNCTTGGGYAQGAAMVLDAENNVSYTCLKVDAAPTILRFDGVGSSNVVLPVTTSGPFATIKVTWSPTAAGATSLANCPTSAANSFSPQTNWTCNYGVLRIDFVPTGGTLTRAGLASGQLSGFFVPLRTGGSGSVAYLGNTGRANVTGSSCNAGTGTCTATITNIPNLSSGSLRLSSMYQTSNISVQALNASNVAQSITGVQAVIDSTGKAQDVLRRIQVRLPVVQTGGLLPSGAITSNGSVCKRFSTTPNSFEIPGDIVERDTTNNMCNPTIDGTPSP